MNIFLISFAVFLGIGIIASGSGISNLKFLFFAILLSLVTGVFIALT